LLRTHHLNGKAEKGTERMDPITMAIVAAVTAGVTSGATEVGKQVIVDAYHALKKLLKQKFGGESKVVKAVEEVEGTPDSKGRQQTLEEEIAKVHADQDPELVQAAQGLLKQLGIPIAGSQHSQTAIGSNIAQAQEGSSANVNVDRGKQA
jgi:hypothetical protein